MEWITMAAERGSAAAQSNLGILYLQKKDYDQSIKMLEKAANQGHAEAQANLGTIYKLGLGVRQDFAIAIKWYTKAAQQGFTPAQKILLDLGYSW
ncbi:MAG: sel1 repeat family protein [Saprospiraceae bacterium]|nr:sel1 repeat family protein [Saprospiraceae bacterium]